MAKYPFLPEAAEYVGRLDLRIEDLSSTEYNAVLGRAVGRVREALLKGIVSEDSYNDEIEILSFPVAAMMTSATADVYFKRRYALAEAKRVYGLLKNEPKGKILEIAGMFNWRVKTAELDKLAMDMGVYGYALYFVDFLRNTTGLREKKWKLVNRFMLDGLVYLTKDEAARLISEEVQRHIEKRLDIEGDLSLPQNVAEQVDQLKQMFVRQRGRVGFEEIPKDVIFDAFPPCIKQLYETIASGRQISHVGRFALTSFLISVGMTPENVINMFRSLSDFSERMTRYQVEHIAGQRGSRTKYTPPRCDTLRTHGVCPGTDDTCVRIRHPLSYYRRKGRGVMKEAPVQRA